MVVKLLPCKICKVKLRRCVCGHVALGRKARDQIILPFVAYLMCSCVNGFIVNNISLAVVRAKHAQPS